MEKNESKVREFFSGVVQTHSGQNQQVENSSGDEKLESQEKKKKDNSAKNKKKRAKKKVTKKKVAIFDENFKNFRTACQNKDVTAASEIVEKFFLPEKINALSKEGLSLLHIACELKFIPIFNVLFEKGADVNVCDANKNTPLMKIVSDSLEVKNNRHQESEFWGDYSEIIGFLLDKEDLEVALFFDQNRSCYYVPDEILKGIHLFSVDFSISSAKKIKNKFDLKLKAELNEKEKISSSVKNFDDSDNVVKFIKSQNKYKQSFSFFYGNEKTTILHEACAQRKYGIIKEILLKGANVNFKNAKGLTPLFCLFLKGFTDSNDFFNLIEFFINLPCIDLLTKDDKGLTVIDHLSGYLMLCNFNPIARGFSERINELTALSTQKTMEQLFEGVENNKFGVDSLGLDNKPVIYWACFGNNKKMLNILFEKGVNSNLKNEKGSTLVMQLLDRQKEEGADFFGSILSLINYHKTDFLACDNDGLSLLEKFIIFQNELKFTPEKIKVLRDLIFKKTAAQVFEKIKKGELSHDEFKLGWIDPFRLACEAANCEMIQFLLDKGVDPNEECALILLFSKKNNGDLSVVDAAKLLIQAPNIDLLVKSLLPERPLINIFQDYLNGLSDSNETEQEKIKNLTEIFIKKYVEQFFKAYPKNKSASILGKEIRNPLFPKITKTNKIFSLLTSNVFDVEAINVLCGSSKINFLKKDEQGNYALDYLVTHYESVKKNLDEIGENKFKNIFEKIENYLWDKIENLKKSNFNGSEREQHHGLFHFAGFCNSHRIIKKLLKKGVDVNIVNKRNQTSLMILFEAHHGDPSVYESAKIIINSKEINLSIQDEKGLTVQHYFEDYIKSLPKYEEKPLLVKQRSSKKLLEGSFLSQHGLLSRAQSNYNMTLIPSGEKIKKSLSIIDLKNQDRSEAKQMLKELATHCRGSLKRTESNSKFDFELEKNKKTLVRSQSTTSLKRSNSSLFYQSKKDLLSNFEEHFNYLKENNLIKKIEKEGAAESCYAYFDMKSLEKKMSSDQIDQLNKRLKAPLLFNDHSLKQIKGDYWVHVNGIPFRLTHEYYIQNNTKPRIFLFQLGSFWIATVYDRNGLHDQGDIDSFKVKIKKPFHLNLPKIKEEKQVLIKGPS